MLYQALTGRKPFLAHTVQGWIEKHLRERPRPPHELEPLVPDLLDRVCMRLLEKDPNLRFASAAHLLFVLGDKEPLEARDRWPPRSVGRRDVKAWARSVVEDVAAGRKGAALLMLVKPQFELQPGQVGKGGIVRVLERTEDGWWSGRCASTGGVQAITGGPELRAGFTMADVTAEAAGKSVSEQQLLHVRSGLCFGIGTFTVVASMLPPIVLKVLSFAGFPSNRAAGMECLRQGVRGGGLRGGRGGCGGGHPPRGRRAHPAAGVGGGRGEAARCRGRQAVDASTRPVSDRRRARPACARAGA